MKNNLDKELQKEKEEKELIIKTAIENYEYAMDKLTDMTYNFIIACKILDDHLPSKTGESWFDVIRNSKKDTYS